MENFAGLIQAFEVVFRAANPIIIFAGCLTGILVGALPGISAINGIALMLPLIYAFSLSPESALILLSGIYYGAEYGASVSSILLNVPGKTIHFTRLDGYPLTCKRKAGKALLISAVSTFCGGMLAVLGLTILKPLLIPVVAVFGPAEYFAIIIFVFVLILILIGTSLAKNLLGLCLGLFLAIIGLDSTTGVLRFGFNTPELYDGIDFIIVVIGLYTLGDALIIIEQSSSSNSQLIKKIRLSITDLTSSIKLWKTILRSSLVGFIIGGLPGTGTSMAGAIAYRVEKKLTDKNNSFGKGNEKGIAASEASSSAATFGAFIPLLSLGIPSSAITAVLLGAMLMVNLNPGPMFYSQQSDLVWILVASMYIGNIVLLLMSYLLVPFFTRIILIPYWILIPIVIVVAFVGVYAIHQSMLALLITLIIGIVSYIFRKLHFSLVPIIIGYILGGPVEVQLRRALATSGGEVSILYQSNLSQAIWIAVILGILFKLIRRKGLAI